jgi:hypothetical protein
MATSKGVETPYVSYVLYLIKVKSPLVFSDEIDSAEEDRPREPEHAYAVPKVGLLMWGGGKRETERERETDRQTQTDRKTLRMLTKCRR